MKVLIAGMLMLFVIGASAQPVRIPEPTLIEKILIIPWALGEFWDGVCQALDGEYAINDDNFWECTLPGPVTTQDA